MHIYSIIHIRLVDAMASTLTRILIASVALSVFAAQGGRAWAETELLMFEEAGCYYCAQWNADVSPEYPITPEGLVAPLVRLNLRSEIPQTYTLNSRPRYTPTFILVQDGVEVGRIEGYPGEDFFWGLLGRLLRAAGHQV
jgi:hypothetical protein